MKTTVVKKKRKPVVRKQYGSPGEAAAAFRAWKEENAATLERVNAQRLEASLGKANAWNAKARATAMGALPSWSDLKAIEVIYAEAAVLGLEVDHVIPLRGQMVCGLHVEGNLRMLTKLENQQKGNRYVPE